MVYGVHTLGMITCSATTFAVPVMLFYLAMIFRYKRKNLKIRNFILALLLCTYMSFVIGSYGLKRVSGGHWNL